MSPGGEHRRGGGLPLGRCLGSLALVAGVFFVNVSSRVVLGPLMPAVERDLGIGHGAAGSLFLLLSLGYCAGLLGSGFLNARISHRATIAVSSAVLGAALLALASTRTLWGLRLGIALVGGAAGTYLPSGVATITSLVVPHDWGKALAFHELAPNLALAVAPLAAEGLLRSMTWRGALAVFGTAALAAACAFAAFGKGGRLRGDPPSARVVGTLVSDGSFRILIVLFGLGLASTVGLFAMLPLYLTAGLGMDRGAANALLSISRASGLVTVLGSGWLSDRLGPRRAMTAVLAVGGAATLLLGLASRDWIVPAVILQPLPTAWFFPAAFASLSSIGPAAVSFAVPLAMVLGAGAVPAFIGALGARGSFGGGIAAIGCLMLAGSVLALRLRRDRAAAR